MIKILLVAVITLLALVAVTLIHGRDQQHREKDETYICPICDEEDCICHRHDDKTPD